MSEVPTNANGQPLSKRSERTRRRLLDAAEQVFGEHGYEAASIVKITEAAGVSQGTFYLYFTSKQQIFDERDRKLEEARARRAALARSPASAQRAVPP